MPKTRKELGEQFELMPGKRGYADVCPTCTEKVDNSAAQKAVQEESLRGALRQSVHENQARREKELKEDRDLEAHGFEGVPGKRIKRKGLAVLLLLCLGSIVTSAQQKRVPAPSALAALAKPITWSPNRIHITPDLNGSLVATLSTSWIPGEDHKGRFRYKISTWPESNDSTKPKLLSLANRCTFRVVLYDEDGFKLRNVAIFLRTEVDHTGNPIGMSANNSVQMDVDEYRRLLGTPGEDSYQWNGGHWELSWGCPAN